MTDLPDPAADPDTFAGDGPLTLEESARRIEGYIRVETQLFEILGGWVPRIPESDVKLRVAPHAHHHAWHADLWRDRLPRPGRHGDEDPVAPEHGAWTKLLDAVREPDDAASTLEKLVGVYGVVLPRKIAAYRAHLAGTHPVADASVRRVLQLTLRDELEHWTEGLSLIDRLVLDQADLKRALDHQARLETLTLTLRGHRMEPRR